MGTAYSDSSQVAERQEAAVIIIVAMSGPREFFRITLGSSLLTAAISAMWLRSHAEGGRVSDTGYYILHPLILELGVDPLAVAPAFLGKFWPLERWTDLCTFTLLATLGLTALNLMIGCIFWPALTQAGKSIRPLRDMIPAVRRAGLTALLLAPAALIPARDFIYYQLHPGVGLNSLIRWSTFYAVGMMVVVLVLIWLALAFLELKSKDGLVVPATSWLALAVGILISAGWLAGWALSPERPADVTKSNVLLVSIDSLRADHLGCYGYQRNTSPNVDQLAQEGVLFETVVAPSSWTLPSHMSLLTALDPIHHGLENEFSRLRPGVSTLVQEFKNAGYATAGFVTNLYVGARWGFARGFDHFDDYSYRHDSVWADGGRDDSRTALDKARRWLHGWSTGRGRRPFFVFLHLMNVHYDYDAPEPYKTMFDPHYAGEITGERLLHDNRINREMPRRVLDHLVARYDGEIRFADACLGELFDDLRRMGVLDNTVIAVTADHGDEFFEHGWKGHRETLYDEVLLVPLILRYPPVLPRGLRVKQQVRLIDVAPTLLSLAGVRDSLGLGALARPPYAARDLTPLAVDGEGAQPAELAFCHLSEVFTSKPAPLYSVRTGDTKLIVSWDKHGQERLEFYDLKTDPREQHNLVAAQGLPVAELRELIEAWRRRRGAPAGRGWQLEPRDLKILKSLGYLK